MVCKSDFIYSLPVNNTINLQQKLYNLYKKAYKWREARQIYVNRKRHEKGAENKDRSAFLVTADGSVVAHNNKDYLPKESGNTTITKVLPELNLKGSSKMEMAERKIMQITDNIDDISTLIGT